VTFSGGGVGLSCKACFTLTLSSTPVNVYQVSLVIGGNYYRGWRTMEGNQVCRAVGGLNLPLATLIPISQALLGKRRPS